MRYTVVQALLVLSYFVAPLGAIAALTVLATLTRRRPQEVPHRNEMDHEAADPMPGASEAD